MAWLGSIWTKIIALALAVLAIFVTAARILAGARRAGVDQARADAADRVMDKVKESTRANLDVAGRTDDALDDGLRAPGSRRER